MGKRLIIKGANFTNVAVDKEVITRWVYGDIDWTQKQHTINTGAKYVCGTCIGQYDWNAAVGKKIIGVKLHVANLGRGTLQFAVVRGFRQNAVQDANNVSYDNTCDVQTISVTETGVQTFMLTTPVVLTENDWVGVGNFESDANIPALYLDESKKGCFVRSQYSTPPNVYKDETSTSGSATPCMDLLYEVE